MFTHLQNICDEDSSSTKDTDGKGSYSLFSKIIKGDKHVECM